MHCLKSFLPDFYQAETDRLSELQPFESRLREGGEGEDSIEYFHEKKGTMAKF